MIQKDNDLNQANLDPSGSKTAHRDVNERPDLDQKCCNRQQTTKSITKIIAMIMLRILFIHHLRKMQIYYISISHFNWLVVFILALFVCCNVSSYKSIQPRGILTKVPYHECEKSY